jgi:hypothetical protein
MYTVISIKPRVALAFPVVARSKQVAVYCVFAFELFEPAASSQHLFLLRTLLQREVTFGTKCTCIFVVAKSVIIRRAF